MDPKVIWRFSISVIFFFLLISLTVLAQDEDPKVSLNFNGYQTDLQTFSFVDGKEFNDIDLDNIFQNRLNFKLLIGEYFSIGTGVRTRVILGQTVERFPFYADLLDVDAGLVDLSAIIISRDSWLIHTQMDRAWLDFSKGDISIRLGRQRINWGVNLIWNPNDIFNVFAFTDFDYEERPGTDAIRFQYYTGPLNKLEIAIAPSKEKKQQVAAAYYNFNVGNYDLRAMGGIYREDLVFGAAWAGIIKNAGFRGELSWFVPYGAPFEGQGLVAAISGDYTFQKGTYIHGEFLYNSFYEGIDLSSAASLLNPDTKSLFPAKYAFFFEWRHAFTPLITAGTPIIYSPEEQLLFFLPTMTFSLSSSVDLILISQFIINKPDIYKLLFSDNLNIRLKWSFAK